MLAGASLKWTALPTVRGAGPHGWTWLAALACITGLAAGVMFATPPEEFEVKAAFLLNFSRFTTWPQAAFAGHPEHHHLCLFGSDPFGPAIDRLLGDRQVNGRRVQIRRVPFPQDLVGCQVIYLAAGELDRLDEVRLVLARRPALLVGEGDLFVEQGGVIGFFLREGRVRFRINLVAATEAGLHLDARMLELAESVLKEENPP